MRLSSLTLAPNTVRIGENHMMQRSVAAARVGPPSAQDHKQTKLPVAAMNAAGADSETGSVEVGGIA